MLHPLTIVILALCAVLGLTGVFYLWRRHLIDDRLLAIAAVLELALVVQLVVGLVKLGGAGGGSGGSVEPVIFVAYLFTDVVVPPFVVFLAIKEKSAWSMGVVIIGAFVVAVLAARLEQIWSAVRG